MSKQISDTMRHAMYDCATNEMFEHFFLNSFFLFSFFILTHAKCKCHMQMPWLVLPMRYATIVPWYAIDRLLTTDLTVSFLWMQTKCDASLDFLFSTLMLLEEDANAIFLLCKCSMQECRCKVYLWCCQCTYLTVMQMSPCRDEMQKSCGANSF